MKFSELPPVYTRLAGFVAGSMAQRLAKHGMPCLVEAPKQSAPLRRQLPLAWRRGWSLATRHDGANEPPVLIVPGFMGPSALLWPLTLFLRLHGRNAVQLHTFPALDGVQAIAERIADAVARLKAETGAEQVDLVTHSMGGLGGRYYMRQMGGAAHVRRFVTIATPHHGTHWAKLALTRSLEDMQPGSPLLQELAAGGPIPGVRCVTIRAGWDQIVWPREHARWGDHADDIELPWTEHWAVQADPRTLALVLTSLEATEEQAPEGTLDTRLPLSEQLP